MSSDEGRCNDMVERLTRGGTVRYHKPRLQNYMTIGITDDTLASLPWSVGRPKSTRPHDAATHLGGIEALRCFAAVMIVIYHTVEIPRIAVPSYLNVIKTHFGMGVPLFYTLSGFVLAYGYMESLGTRKQIIEFYIRRFFRIAPLFYVMLGTWIVFSKLKWEHFSVSYTDVALNLTLLFGLVPGRHISIVWAGWSIGIEVLFYIVFPIFTVLLMSIRFAVIALCISLLVSSMEFRALTNLNVGSYAFMNLITHLPFFISGILAYLVWRGDNFSTRRVLGSSIFIGVLSIAALLVYSPMVYTFLVAIPGVMLGLYIWALVFAALILSICYSSNPVVVNRVTRHLGRASFSMYLLHPLIIVASADLYKILDRALGVGVLGLVGRILWTLSVVSAVASLSYLVIEKPAMRFGRNVAKNYRARGSSVVE